MTGSDIRSYRLDPAAFDAAAKRRIRKRLAWIVPLVAVLLTLEFAYLSRVQAGAADTLPFVIPATIVLLGIAFVRGVRLQLKNDRAAWDSYQLAVGPNVLRRFIANLPPVEILRTEVTRIVDAEGEGLTVATADRHRFVYIPKELLDFQSARDQLAAWCPFEPPKRAANRALAAVWSVLLVGSWIACGVLPDLRLAMLSGVVLLLVGAFTIRETLRSNIVDNKHKAKMTLVVIFLMLAPVARLALLAAFGALAPR